MNVPSQPFHSQLGGELVQPRYVVRNEATRRQGERPRDDAPKAAASNAGDVALETAGNGGYPRLRPVVTMLRGPTARFRRRWDLLCPVEHESPEDSADPPHGSQGGATTMPCQPSVVIELGRPRDRVDPRRGAMAAAGIHTRPGPARAGMGVAATTQSAANVTTCPSCARIRQRRPSLA